MWLLLGALGCGTGADAPMDWPEAWELPEAAEAPDPLTRWTDGAAVDDADAWREERAPEIRSMLHHYAYGVSLDAETVRVGAPEVAADALDGRAELVQLDFEVGERGAARLLLVRPRGAIRPPVVLGLEKCGLHTALSDDRVAISAGWAGPACETERGERASAWDLVAAVEAGLAVAIVHQSDFAPDDRELLDEGLAGAAPAPEGDDRARWGAVSAWAWGLSRALDALLAAELVDPERVAVMGHSRRGKAALWASAQDDRFAFVWAHQSGTLGAALTRVPEGGADEGESLEAITTFFPHWFAPRLPDFVGREAYLPFDQHLLIALSAPRPVLLIDGEADRWADPEGALAALRLAEPVWALHEAQALARQRRRAGGHEVTAEDWAIFLEELPSSW